MSTRGVIARVNGDGFIGRYHHWDSYPSGLGRTLWEWSQKMPLDKMLKLLLDEHPAGWSTIVHTDPSLTPGFIEDVAKAGTSNNPMCYCHGERHDPEQTITDKDAAECGCEYAYVFCEENRVMSILTSHEQPEGKWRLIASINLDGPEPDWGKLDEE